VKEVKDNDDDDNSVLFGRIFDILKKIKCKGSCYELLIGIQGLRTSLFHVYFTFAALFGYVHLIIRYNFIYFTSFGATVSHNSTNHC